MHYTRSVTKLVKQYSVNQLETMQSAVSQGIDRAYAYNGHGIAKSKMKATIQGLKKRYQTLERAIVARKAGG